MRELTEPEKNILRLFSPDTYCIDLGTYGVERVRLENMGLIKWVPRQAWSGHYTYGITAEGIKVLESLE